MKQKSIAAAFCAFCVTFTGLGGAYGQDKPEVLSSEKTISDCINDWRIAVRAADERLTSKIAGNTKAIIGEAPEGSALAQIRDADNEKLRSFKDSRKNQVLTDRCSREPEVVMQEALDLNNEVQSEKPWIPVQEYWHDISSAKIAPKN